MGSEKACVLLTPRPASCIFQTADKKDDLPGDESVLEMLSYSKFSDLETWLCMPSSVHLPRSLDSSSSSSSQSSVRSTGSVPGPGLNSLSLNASRALNSSQRSLCSRDGDRDRSEKVHSFLTPTLVRDSQFLSTPVLTSTPLTAMTSGTTVPMTPDESSPGGVTLRKRRRLAASPGGLHWNSAGSVQRDFLSPASPDPSPTTTAGAGVGGACRCCTEEVTLRKTISADNYSPQSSPKLRLLTRLEHGTRRLRHNHTGSAAGRYDSRKKTDGGSIGRLAQRWKRWSLGDGLNSDITSWFYSGLDQSSSSLDRCVVGAMQQMQSLQLTPRGRCPGPTSPNAAKRLYRNLSDKLRGSTSSIEDSYFFGKSDRLRKASTAQYSEVLFEAVEQQDLDTVQILLFQFSPEELDLNTPNCQGLTPLDISIMTNNAPIAKLLLRAGAKESPHFTSVESREAHLSSLVLEAERRAAELAAQAQREGLSLDACHNNKALRSWEWRSRLYARMRAGFQHARPPEAPTMVRLSVSSSSTLSVTFQEPQCLNSTVVTKYRVEWSCLKDFSLLVGDAVLDNLQSLRFTISGLTPGRVYFVRVSAFNMKGWGPPACSLPPSAAPSNWRECDGRESKQRGQIEAMEKLLQQVRETHTLYCSGDPSKLQNSSRKQSVSRSLKHLFNSNKFIKTLKRGVYLATVLHHKDSLLVTTEEQIPIVEVDDSFGSSLMQDFLWFTKLSCLWEDVRWLRQSMSVSMSSSSTLQTRHKLLTAAAHMQNLLGTHNLGRVHYEPIKDRHGNVLLVTIRELDAQTSALNGKWTAVTKVQSQRKSLSTPEEPYALDILIITLQDLLSFQRRCSYRLSPGLYLGYLKLSSSVDQIRVLVSQRSPNMLCHARVRENANVSKEEWEWIQSLAASSPDSAVIGGEAHEAGLAAQSHTPLLYYELQTAMKALLKQINLTPLQARGFRLYSQEVVELGHGVSFLLMLPAADDVCSAPGQTNPLCPLSGFLHLPLQMFELVHLCSYKERYISLYCRVSSVLDLDSLVTQQALREAITDMEVSTAKERHQQILDYIQQLDEMRRDLRWLTDALQFARYKQPRGGVPLSSLMPLMSCHTESHHTQKSDSTSSNMDYLPTPSPSPELRRRAAGSDSHLCSDEDCSSEVFLPTDSDYDSSDALSPPQDTLSPPSSVHSQHPMLSPPSSIYSHQSVLSHTSSFHSHQPLQLELCPRRTLGGSAPDVLRCSVGPSDSDLSPSTIKDCKADAQTLVPIDLPLSSPHSPTVPSLSPVSNALDTLSLSCPAPSEPSVPPNPNYSPVKPASSAPAKRKLLSRSHRGQYFSGPQRWIRAQSGETPAGTLSEGVYTKQSDFTEHLPGVTYVSHASCILEKRRSQQPRPHVRKIFTQNITKTQNMERNVTKNKSPSADVTKSTHIITTDSNVTENSAPNMHRSNTRDTERVGWGRSLARGTACVVEEQELAGPEGAMAAEVDSDDQTNAQVQEILSSAL